MYRFSVKSSSLSRRIFQIAVGFVIISVNSVLAQETSTSDVIEEVVVTAEFRDATVSKLPVSVTVIHPNESGSVVNHLEEVLGQAANVNFSNGASRARFIQIRGIGERGQFAEPLNSSVGLIVDGVDLSGIGAAATLFDVQQIEILRGPQGTLYGANALAGLINIVTPDPTGEHTTSLRLDAADYNGFGIGGVVSGPVSDNTGYRVSVHQYRDDGFINNDFLDRENTNNRQEATYRAKIVWQGDSVDGQVSAGRIDIDNGYDAFSLQNNRTTLSDQPGVDQQQTNYAAAKFAWDMTDSVVFEGALSYAESDIVYGYDEDWTFDGFDPIGYVSTDLYERQRDTTTIEGRWLSKQGAGLFEDRWDWVFGVYGLYQDVELMRTHTFTGSFESAFDTQRLAVYGEVSRDLSEGFRLTLGVRFERHSAQYDDSNGVSFNPEDNLIGGRILLERNLSDNSLVYAGLTQGYKSGGFNQDGSLPADLRRFDPETLWNVEVGYKTWLLDGLLSLRATIFRMQRKDMHVSSSTTRPIAETQAVEFIEFTGNESAGVNQGVEVEVEYYATESLKLFANLGLLDAQYRDYINENGDDLDGRDQAQAPNYQFFVGAEYQLGQGWWLRVEVEGKDDYFFSASHDAKSDSFELIHASLGYQADNWSVRLWGRNLGDEDYFVRGFFFGNDPTDGYTARSFTQLGEPRQIGISFEANL